MLVGGGKLILTKGDAKFTEAQVHGPDDGVLLLSKGAEAFDDLEAAHGQPPLSGNAGSDQPGDMLEVRDGSIEKSMVPKPPIFVLRPPVLLA